MHNLLTIILTLKGRHEFTLRWLRWANSQRCPFKILIADGSRDETAQTFLTAENTKHLDVEYFKYKYDETLRDFFSKTKDVLSRVQTKYTIHADNDDFLLFARLLESVRERERYGIETFYTRPQYTIDFDVSRKGKEVNIDKILYPRKLFYLHRVAPNIEVRSNADPMVRLVFVMNVFPAAIFWYGIHSTSLLRSIHEFIFSSGIELAFFQELYLVYNTAIRNQIVYQDAPPYLVRQEFTSQGAKSLYGSEALHRIFLNPTWSHDLHAFIIKLHSDILSEGILITLDEFEDVFYENLRNFFLKWNRFSYLSLLAKESVVLRTTKRIFEKWSYARTHQHMNKFRHDQELVKLKDFLLPK